MNIEPHAYDHIINELRGKIRLYEKTLLDIKQESNTWDSVDRDYILNKVNQVLNEK